MKEMKKIIALGAALLVLVIALLTIVIVKHEEKKRKDKEIESQQLVLCERESLRSLTVEESNGAKTVIYMDDNSSAMKIIRDDKEFSKIMLDTAMVNNWIDSVLRFSVENSFDSSDDLSAYGLSSPQYRISAEKKDGTNTVFSVGNLVSNQSGVYLQLAGENKVYVASYIMYKTLSSPFENLLNHMVLYLERSEVDQISLERKSTKDHWTVKTLPDEDNGLFIEPRYKVLYPMQREVNKINAKQQQLIHNYKGATPVFNSDVELAMKSITNGAGECLYVDSQRPLDSLMTVINPTPLDPELSGVIQEYKSTMYELAGVQNASFDMENMRSAAAVVALDQTRDSVFQAQLSGLADFISDALSLYIKYNAAYKSDDDQMDWDAVLKLIDTAYISLKPVHLNDPLSDEDKDRQEQSPMDYIQLCTARVVLGIMKGKYDFNSLPYYVDWHQVTLLCAATLIKFEALGIEVPDNLQLFLISAFVEDVKEGGVQI